MNEKYMNKYYLQKDTKELKEMIEIKGLLEKI